jgi:hypothetical protein
LVSVLEVDSNVPLTDEALVVSVRLPSLLITVVSVVVLSNARPLAEYVADDCPWISSWTVCVSPSAEVLVTVAPITSPL